MCKPEESSFTGNGAQQEGAQFSLFIGTVQRAAYQMASIARELEVSQQPTMSSSSASPEPSDPTEVVVSRLAGSPADELETKDQDKSSVGAKKSKRRYSSRSSSAATKQSDNNHEQHDHKRSRVEHHYHDYANFLSDDLPDAEVEKKSRGGISSPFPIILHSMLERADTQGHSGIVSWQPHGRAFHVHDQTRFIAEIMPLFTRMTRFSSFQRQLSLYGFLRLTRKGSDHGAYYHELFLRGKPRLCHKMQRTRVKGYWVRQSSSPETEPDFAGMIPVGPSSEPAHMWVGTNVAMLPLPTTTTTAATTTVGPVSATGAFHPLAHGGSLWELMQLSPASLIVNNEQAAGKMKLPPMPPLATSCMVDLNYGFAPLSVDNNDNNYNVTTPPFRPLKPPPVLSLKTAGAAAPAPAPSPLDVEFPRAPRASPEESAGEEEMMGHQHTIAEIASEFSAAERQDIAAFLSDVDLDSEDEKDAAYKNEEELGRILLAKKSSKKVSSV
jgi:HSF-type DNA-binding